VAEGDGSCQQACSLVGFSLHGSTGHCEQTVPLRAPHGVTASFGHSPAPACGPPWLQVHICSTVDVHGLQADSLPHNGLHHKLQGNLCSGAWSTSSPSFFPDLGVCRVISLTYSHYSVRLHVLPHRIFFPFSICDHRGTTIIADRLGLGQWQVHLGASWHCLYWTQGKLLAPPQSSHPCSSTATKMLPCKPTAPLQLPFPHLSCIPSAGGHVGASTKREARNRIPTVCGVGSVSQNAGTCQDSDIVSGLSRCPNLWLQRS